MKKLIIAGVAVAVMLGGIVVANAQEEAAVKVKAKAVETKSGPEVQVKGTGETPETKSKITGAIKEEGAEREAKVETKAKGTQQVLKRKVKFHSFDRDTDTITVIQEKKLVRYPAKDLDSKRPYVLKWEKEKPIEITSTYDPKLGKDVVLDAATTPLQ
jgi:outer membrane lipoprotein-sorting protein